MNRLIEVDNSHYSQSDTQCILSVTQDNNSECNSSGKTEKIEKVAEVNELTILSLQDIINYVTEKGREVSTEKGKHPIKALIEHVLKGGELIDIFNFNHLKSIFKAFIKINTGERLVKRTFNCKGKVIFVGDIHGYLESLDQILFDINDHDFVFLGDYVDRGEYQLECLIFIYLLKIFRPYNTFILRGNHEAMRFNESEFLGLDIPRKLSYFKDEQIEEIQQLAYDSFDYLDLCLVFNDECFCVHGGITSDFNIMKGLIKGNKPLKFNYQSIDEDTNSVLQLLWNDPKASDKEFICNNERGDGCKCFNEKAVTNFFKWFNKDIDDTVELRLVIRGHQMVESGFKFSLSNVITVFSAYDYCETENVASFLLWDGKEFHIINFYKERSTKQFFKHVLF